jgi:mannan endo-1,4-beta-mannosidase
VGDRDALGLGYVVVGRGPDGVPRLERDGRPLGLGLVNAYYLQEEAARGRLDVVDETLASARALGATVVRAWAFNDDPHKDDSAIRRGISVYRESGLVGLDRLLLRARAHGVGLILALADHWNAYGGARQAMRWAGVEDAVEGDARFYADAGARAAYAAHVATLLRRVNALTGLRYGEDATVVAWELCNEPRGRDAAGRTADAPGAPPGSGLRAWVAEAARAVKAHARQLVSVGDEGEDVSAAGWDPRLVRAAPHLFAPSTATSFSAHLACPDVDVASAHLYPHKWGLPASLGGLWIAEHARRAHAAGKPLVVGEMGIALPSRRARARHLARWLTAAARSGVAVAGPWLFVYRERPRAWDELSFGIDDPEARALAAACAMRL